VVTARELGRFNAEGGLSALAVTADGSLLISASPDSTLLVWNIKAAPNQLRPHDVLKVITFGD
jgi:hypothetical protein